MINDLTLLDASAFWRLGSPQLDPRRRDELSERIARGTVAASTPLLLEVRADGTSPQPTPRSYLSHGSVIEPSAERPHYNISCTTPINIWACRRLTTS